MRQIKTCQFSAFDGLLQCFVLKFGDFAALGADLVMMRIPIVAFFIL